MTVYVTYTFSLCVDVPDGATDKKINEACAAAAPCSYDNFEWEEYEL